MPEANVVTVQALIGKIADSRTAFKRWLQRNHKKARAKRRGPDYFAKSEPVRLIPMEFDFHALVLAVFAFAVLQRSTENITKRGTRIGGAILGNCFFFLSDFKRLDGNGNPTGLFVELGDACIDFLAN